MNEKQRMEELSLSWNRGKNEQICSVKFQNFLGAMPPDPHTGQLGRGYGAPPQTQPLGTGSLGAFGPSIVPHSLSVCSWHFEIFRTCILAPLKFKMADGAILKIVKSPYLNEWELDLLQLHFVQREGAWADTWRHLLLYQNVTAHLSTASVPTT